MFLLWDEEKLKKLFELAQKMQLLECVHYAKQLVKYSFLDHLEKNVQSVKNVVKNLNYSSKNLPSHQHLYQ